ncbi:putative membrane protein [Acinetobacter baumannii 1294222]|nr:putative membrane protein [Acinetobacter baumannii 1294222]
MGTKLRLIGPLGKAVLAGCLLLFIFLAFLLNSNLHSLNSI